MIAEFHGYYSGMAKLRGRWDKEPQPVAWLEQFMATKQRVYVMLDTSRFPIDLSTDENGLSEAIFDWLPSSSPVKAPRLFELASWPNWREAVEEVWGSDAMMVLSCSQAKEQLLSHLRKLVRGSGQSGETPQSVRGICWPAVLGSLLDIEATGFANEYFTVVDSVWTEAADEPNAWQWVGKPEVLSAVCQSMGIRLRDLSKASTK